MTIYYQFCEKKLDFAGFTDGTRIWRFVASISPISSVVLDR